MLDDARVVQGGGGGAQQGGGGGAQLRLLPLLVPDLLQGERARQGQDENKQGYGEHLLFLVGCLCFSSFFLGCCFLILTLSCSKCALYRGSVHVT